MQPETWIPLAAYLLGSIPFGFLLVRLGEGKDIRRYGSGNIGATNVFRKNRGAGVLTLVLDAAKGYLAVLAAGWLGGGGEWQAAAAFCAIAGHVFTLWLRFRGGKGVATGCGAFLALSPPALATALVAFALVFALSRYVSAASIAAAALFPLFAFFYGAPAPVLCWAALGALLIIVKHRENINRLRAGTENRFRSGARS